MSASSRPGPVPVQLVSPARENCEAAAWECLQALLRAGHRSWIKAPAKATQDDFASLAPSCTQALQKDYALSFAMRDWPDRFERLKKEMAFENA